MVILAIHGCDKDSSSVNPKACFDYLEAFDPLIGNTITF